MKIFGFFKVVIIVLILMLGGCYVLFSLVAPLGVYDRAAIFQANEFSILEGIRIQRAIASSGQCPSMPAVWSSKSKLPEYQYETYIPRTGRAGSVVPIWYKCKDDLNFLIWVRYSIDSDLSLSGGKGKQLTIQYGHFSEPKTLVIPSDMDEKLVMSKLREENLIAK